MHEFHPRGSGVRGLWASCWGAGLAVALGCGAGAQEDELVEERVQALHAAGGLSQVTLATGIEVTYREVGSAHGIPVIFLHGFTDSHHSFDRNLPTFSRRFHVFALDQRGHGDSSKPSCCYALEDFAADVPAFMDAVGLEHASIVGHSMGSFIAQEVAIAYPERVDRLVLIGSAAKLVGNPVALELQAAVNALSDPIDPEFVRAFQASTFFQPVPESYFDTLVAGSLKVPASVWQQALDALIAQDNSAELKEIGARTLILYGDRDAFLTSQDQSALDAGIPRSRLITFPETGHGVHAERPQAVNRVLERFLR